MAVTPVRSDNGAYLDNVNASAAYFPAGGTFVDGPTAFYDGTDTGGFSLTNRTAVEPVPLDLTKSISNDQSPHNVMFFLVTSDKVLSVAANSRSIVVVTANGPGGYRAIPIEFVTAPPTPGAACSDSNCMGYGSYPDLSGFRLYAGADIPGLTATPASPTPGGTTGVIVGIYPRDLCFGYRTAVGGGGQPAYGCDNSDNPIPDGTTTALPNGGIQLSFGFYSIATTGGSAPTNAVATTNALDTAVPLTIYFSTKPPAMTCPNTPSFPTNLYNPGDGEIQITASDAFTSSLASSASIVAPYLPPASKLIVVAAASPTAPNLSATYSRSGTNPIVDKITIGDNTRFVTGFTNTDDPAAPHAYTLGFMVRDKAGFVGISSGCTLANVETSTIQGFLRKGNCFIATAAFRSVDAAPVELLRQFRGRVLTHSGAGRAFVSWYYSHSPAAAEWLMEHPSFRAPVLLALLPLEGLAWLLLNPAPLAAFLGLNVLAVAALLLARRRRPGQVPEETA